jgi:hypothetical protein
MNSLGAGVVEKRFPSISKSNRIPHTTALK